MRWFIYHDLPEGWQWAVYDDAGNVVARCSGSFATREECVADAKSNGYQSPDDESDERAPT
jgi:hypothetical protein